MLTITATTTDCGDPPVIINGARTWTDGSQAPVDTTVAYSCDPGYERDGANEIVCTDSGDWSDPPNCTESCKYILSKVPVQNAYSCVVSYCMICSKTWGQTHCC